MNCLNDDNFMRQFSCGRISTGSGTSSNMNANEVIATLASVYYGGASESLMTILTMVRAATMLFPADTCEVATVRINRNLLPAAGFI